MDLPLSKPAARAARIPAETYFVGSAVFHYLGPSFAVLLFARVPVLGVAWLRILSAAVVLAAWRRPWRHLRGLDRQSAVLLLALGADFAVMNSVFYEAIARLPLATVAAIEFLGPILLAAVGARSRRNVLALALAVPGVYVITGIALAGDALGLVFAFANAALFTAYIALGHRLSRRAALGGVDGLAAAMVVAAVVATPIGAWGALPALADPVAVGAGIGVGLSSSVVPYVFDQLAMARLSRATYSVMVALLPATATVVGVLVLAQLPTPAELAGIALVVLGVAVHRDPAAEPTSAPRPA